MDKNLADFATVSKNMREEGCNSRADVIDYLIARVMIAETKLDIAYKEIGDMIDNENENA